MAASCFASLEKHQSYYFHIGFDLDFGYHFEGYCGALPPCAPVPWHGDQALLDVSENNIIKFIHNIWFTQNEFVQITAVLSRFLLFQCVINNLNFYRQVSHAIFNLKHVLR